MCADILFFPISHVILSILSAQKDKKKKRRTKCRNLFRSRLSSGTFWMIIHYSCELSMVVGPADSPRNLWRLVNHPIIPSSFVSLSRTASRSSTSALPSPPPLSLRVTLSVAMSRDCAAPRATVLYGPVRDNINCYKIVSPEQSDQETKDFE